MLMPNRHGSNDTYRYRFQGQEKDDEIKGEGNSLNYKFRMHDPRIGRFFAVDPLDNKYPWNSSYSFSENRVLDGNEIEGLEYGPQRWMIGTPSANAAGMTSESFTRGNLYQGKTTYIMIEGQIDGVAYFLTSSDGAVIYPSPDPRAYGFTFENGFQPEISYFYNPTLGNSFRYFGGAIDLVGLSSTAAVGLGNILKTASKLKKSGSKLVSTRMLEDFLESPTYGNPAETFIAPSKEIDDLLSQGLSRPEIAKKLGINDPNFFEGDLIRIDIDKSLTK